MKRSACRRIRRNCHHLRKMRYQETIENTTRMARTNLVSRLDVRTSSQGVVRSEEHTSELQSRLHLVCRLLLEKKKSLRNNFLGNVDESHGLFSTFYPDLGVVFASQL